jgi:hypothetical protein
MAAAVVLGLGSAAFADNDTQANAHTFHLGQVRSDVAGASRFQWFRVELVSGRSYEAYCWIPLPAEWD